jgi:hypothetical protein
MSKTNKKQVVCCLPAGPEAKLKIVSLDVPVPMLGLAKSHNQAHVDLLNLHWDTRLVVDPILSWHLGQLHIIKGHTTIELLKQHQFTEWPCKIVQTEGVQDMFRLRFKQECLCKRETVSVDRFRFGVGSKDNMYCDIAAIVHYHKFRIPANGDERRYGRQDNTLPSIGALETVYQQYGGRQGLDQTLQVIVACFLANPTTQLPQAAAVRRTFMVGLASFLYAAPVPVPAVITAIQAAHVNVEHIIDDAEREASARYGRCNRAMLHICIRNVLSNLVSACMWQMTP